MRGLFVTGTDTGVGKTLLTASLAARLTAAGRVVGVYKPACSGAISSSHGMTWDDVESLHAASGGRWSRGRIAPQRFLAALSPPAAAAAEGTQVDATLLRTGAAWWHDQCELLLVEGVGGLLCPLTERETVADLAVDLGFPLLIVARAGLGTINHTLLSVEAATRRGLCVAGIVLNATMPSQGDESVAGNAAEITARCGIPVLASIPYRDRSGGSGLCLPDATATIDVFALARRCIWDSAETPNRPSRPTS